MAKKVRVLETIHRCLIESGENGISLKDLAKFIYGRNNKKYELRIIKNVGLLRIRKGLKINYDKKTRRYLLLSPKNTEL
ncbi:hypothetical protein [Desulfoscipio gibsoniae]|uniref:Uncharacterized protein n=1 Tax=Desulfoscipio gibsoniae DSM 7213 TaxID=767817 RepID=R4KNC8_9FIRM|nr:hypothetical protein [Desulfoscipio gibsoniae]AGL01136.1 hypothetical protein Desgi_1665 [Desulfoscipio gibsoniae DSM 7213]